MLDKIENTKIGAFIFGLCEDFCDEFIIPKFYIILDLLRKILCGKEVKYVIYTQ